MNQELNEVFLIKLNAALDRSGADVVDVIQEQYHSGKIPDIMPLVAEFGYLLCIFNFRKSEDNAQEVREVFALALTSEQKRQDTGRNNLERLRTFHVMDKYLKDNSDFIDRDLYLMVKESFFASEQMSNKVTMYFKHFVPHLTQDDFTELWERFVADRSNNRQGWMFTQFVKDAIKREIVDDKYLVEALELAPFRFLPQDIRDKYAEIAVATNYANYKHISNEMKAQLADKVDYYERPMMIMHHPDLKTLSGASWEKLIAKDMRVLRHVPKGILGDRTVFSDEYLLSVLERNDERRYSRYRLISFINEIAPERLTVEFCNQIREKNLIERHHPVIVNVK